jgi:hypothetical protein
MSYRIKSLAELPADVRRRMGDVTARADAAADIDLVRRKYRNQPTEVNGIEFPSKWEAQRYGELLIMERQGLITDLQVHVPFALHVTDPNGVAMRAGAYEADAVYWRGERMFVEDSKSAATKRDKTYVWKKRHFELEYGLRIIEVERNKPRSGHRE